MLFIKFINQLPVLVACAFDAMDYNLSIVKLGQRYD